MEIELTGTIGLQDTDFYLWGLEPLLPVARPPA